MSIFRFGTTGGIFAVFVWWPINAFSLAVGIPSRIGVIEILERTERLERIVFVDAREKDEQAEERIPQALHLPLRAVSLERTAVLGVQNTLVVAYCIKDFRGYEVARALQRQGYTNVRVMVDPGLKGWKAAKLPTAGALPGRTDEQAMAELKQRAAAYVKAHPATALPLASRPSPP